MKKLTLAFFIFCASTAVSFGQSARLDFFGVNKIDIGAVQLQWTMSAGSTCFRMELQRSRDGERFQTIYTYPGVCGDSDSAVSYSWVDAQALSYSLSYYRLKLGETEFSEVKPIDLDAALANEDMTLSPNPASDLCRLRFRNPKRKEAVIHIYNSNGNLIGFENLGTASSFDLQLLGYKAGIYFVQLRLGEAEALEAKRLLVLP